MYCGSKPMAFISTPREKIKASARSSMNAVVRFCLGSRSANKRGQGEVSLLG